MAKKESEEPSGPWLALREARRLLGVNETTLRHWADSGRVRSFRTPGGHRRFSREDIASFTRERSVAVAVPQLEERTLRRMRRRLHAVRSPEPWAESLDEEGRNRLRVMGRRLVELSLLYHTQRARRGQLLEEARFLGAEYGAEMARQNVGLTAMLEAFVFHKRMLVEAVRDLIKGSSGPDEVRDELVEIGALADQMLLAMATSYQRASPSPAPTNRS
ncbi:MAG: helix-turn-helix domain-containing protein [Chloroflexi bacterium]|nr:helix-turn-helix domain-containing protein [Chloroflexota bacterium]